MKSKLLTVTVTAGAAAMALGWALAPGALAANSPAPLTEGSSASLMAGHLNVLGPNQFAASFAGVQVTDSQDVTVFLTHQDPGLVAEVDALAGSAVHVDYVTVTYSLQQLITLEQQIALTDSQALAAEGVNMVSISPDVATNSLVVTLATPSAPVADYVSSAQTVLSARYGARLVSVQGSTMAPFVATYRDNDYAPFYGGDSVGDGSGYCSTGFSLDGGTAILTAGHCFPNGAQAYIYCWRLNSPDCTTTTRGNLVGTVGNRHLDDGWDFETIATSASPTVWLGSYTNECPGGSCISAVIGTTNPAIGSNMTLDGSVTGEVRGLEVTAQNTCDNIGSEGWVCGMGHATGSSPPCQGGDSGGPAYVHTTGGVSPVLAAGIILDVSGDTCGFEDISAILANLPGWWIDD